MVTPFLLILLLHSGTSESELRQQQLDILRGAQQLLAQFKHKELLEFLEDRKKSIFTTSGNVALKNSEDPYQNEEEASQTLGASSLLGTFKDLLKLYNEYKELVSAERELLATEQEYLLQLEALSKVNRIRGCHSHTLRVISTEKD
jgi:hypothetical protein